MKPRKLQFIFGNVTLTLTPADIETVMVQWEKENHGRQMSGKEFADRCIERLAANSKQNAVRT